MLSRAACRVPTFPQAAEVVEAMSLATAKSGATLLGTPFGRLDLARDIRPCDLSVFKVRS